MKEKPIIFSSEMVRAILDGRKTQTRRIIKPTPTNIRGYCVGESHPDVVTVHCTLTDQKHTTIKCAYGKPGDRLWVRETFRKYSSHTSASVKYKADGDYFGDEKWKPSIHMPRKLSRITLEIIDIRVERLQDISEEDAKREGVDGPESESAKSQGWYMQPRAGFRFLWQSINGPNSWYSNPWVWVIEFKKV